jgi:hypothetical protein
MTYTRVIIFALCLTSILSIRLSFKDQEVFGKINHVSDRLHKIEKELAQLSSSMKTGADTALQGNPNNFL